MVNNFLATVVLPGLEGLINQVLKQDPGTLKRLEALEGKIIHIQFVLPDMAFYLMPHGHGLNLLGSCAEEPDLHIKGSAPAFMRFLSTDRKADVTIGGDIRISGDLILAQQLQGLLDGVDIDWEDKLAQLFGDIPAHHIGRQVRAFVGWSRTTAESMTGHIEEYLHEEARALPSKAETERFYRDVDALTLQLDRVKARAQRLGSLSSRQEKKSP